MSFSARKASDVSNNERNICQSAHSADENAASSRLELLQAAAVHTITNDPLHNITNEVMRVVALLLRY
jgi:hypothetical protein